MDAKTAPQGVTIAREFTLPAEEKPDRVGGTARIVDCRLSGPDVIAKRIVSQSGELRPPVVLDPPQTGPVWLIDLDTVDRSPDSPLRAVTRRRPGSGSAETGKVETIRWKRGVDLVEGLATATAINRLNERLAALPHRQWRRISETQARPDSTGDPRSELDPLRRGVAIIQQGFISRMRCLVPVMAALFVAAIFVLELYIEFQNPVFLKLYLFIFMAILVLFGLARGGRWQRYSEDYRAVAEALRVQLAWWDAGLTTLAHRVDRVFSTGTEGSSGLLRAAIRHLIDAAAVVGEPRSEGSPLQVDSWINGQIDFFRRRAHERQSSLALLEDLSAFALFAALGIWFTQFAEIYVSVVYISTAAMGVGVLGICLARVIRFRRKMPTMLAAIVAIAAGALFSSVVDTSGITSGITSGMALACSDSVVQKLVAATAVSAVALAGALLGRRIARVNGFRLRPTVLLSALVAIAAGAAYFGLVYLPGASCASAAFITEKLCVFR